LHRFKRLGVRRDFGSFPIEKPSATHQGKTKKQGYIAVVGLRLITPNEFNMPTLEELEFATEAATTDLAKIQALNALAKELQNRDTRRAKTLAESALQLIGEHQTYTHEKATALLVLGFCHFRLSDNDIAMQQSKDAHALFEQAGDKNGVAASLNNIGNVYYSLADYSQALKNYQESLSISKSIGDKKDVATSLNNLGNVYSSLADYPEARKHFQESLSIRRDIGDKSGIAGSLNNLGNVSSQLADYAEALKSYQESLSISKSISDKKTVASSLNNLGSVYSFLADYPEARKYLQESLNVFRDIGFKQGMASSLNNLGNIYFALADYPEALKHQQDSFSLNRDIGNKRGMANAIKDIGSIFIKLHRFEEAETHLQQSLLLCDELGLKQERFEALGFLAQLYAETKQFEKAYLTHIEFYNAKEAVFSTETQKQLTNLQVRFETEQSQKEAELYRLKTIELAEANRFKTELLSLAAHDLQSPLQAIMGFAQLIQQTDGMPRHVEKKIINIIHASENMNRLIADLLDTAAMEQSKISVTKIPVAIAELAENVVTQYQQQANTKNQTIHFFADQPCVVETDADKLQRVLENLISNAVKYSPKDKSIWVMVAEVRGAVQLSVRDNGQGIMEAEKEKLFRKFQRLSARPTDGETSTGLGLAIAKQFTELLGGSIRCESAGKNQGATFIVDLPKSSR
jgi:signal transduction histidine kinase